MNTLNLSMMKKRAADSKAKEKNIGPTCNVRD